MKRTEATMIITYFEKQATKWLVNKCTNTCNSFLLLSLGKIDKTSNKYKWWKWKDSSWKQI